LVTNGVYQGDGVVLNTNRSTFICVALTNAVVVQSVNGPQASIITSSGAVGVRCGYVGSNAILTGFTLTNGYASGTGDTNLDQSGGGLWCELGGTISNCVVTGNRAPYNGAGAFQGTYYDCVFSNNTALGGQGGGVCNATLYNCLVVSNSTVNSSWGVGVYGCTLYNCSIIGNRGNNVDYGGGAAVSTMQNCLLAGNYASYGGGAYICTSYNCTISGNSSGSTGAGAYRGMLTNCIVYYNTTSGNSSNWGPYTVLRWSCTAPMPTNGSPNITNEPAFVNRAAGDFRLHFGSPCVDAGTNSARSTATAMAWRNLTWAPTNSISWPPWAPTGSSVMDWIPMTPWFS
jgi:hypothetical protein